MIDNCSQDGTMKSTILAMVPSSSSTEHGSPFTYRAFGTVEKRIVYRSDSEDGYELTICEYESDNSYSEDETEVSDS